MTEAIQHRQQELVGAVGNVNPSIRSRLCHRRPCILWSLVLFLTALSLAQQTRLNPPLSPILNWENEKTADTKLGSSLPREEVFGDNTTSENENENETDQSNGQQRASKTTNMTLTTALVPETRDHPGNQEVVVVSTNVTKTKARTASATQQISNSTSASSVAGNLWVCGYTFQRITHYLFPEFTNVGRLQSQTMEAATANDLLVIGMHGPCGVNDADIANQFPGKVLYTNGEPHGIIRRRFNKTRHNIFQISGPVHKRNTTTASSSLSAWNHDEHILQIYYGILTWVDRYAHEEHHRQVFLDSSKRPKWTDDPNHNASTVGRVIYAHSNCLPHRQRVANLLAKRLPLDSGGKCTVRKAHPVTLPQHHYVENWKFYAQYKYCLVMENSAVPGYISEKILFGFMGGCLPIYWGTKEAMDVFDPRAFVFLDFNATSMSKNDKDLASSPSMRTAVQEITKLEANYTLYQ